MDLKPRSQRVQVDSLSPGDKGYADGDAAAESSKAEDLKSLSLIPEKEAWEFDISDLLDSPTTIPTSNPSQTDGNNFKNYDPAKSLFALCVLGKFTLQLDLIYRILPNILRISQNLQILILTSSPADVLATTSCDPYVLPIVEAKGNPANHFLKLGLLDPLGDGKRPMDAIVLLDASGRRRLVLPFGWGVGRHIADALAAQVVQDTFYAVLEESVEALEAEKVKSKSAKDFYAIAKTYF